MHGPTHQCLVLIARLHLSRHKIVPARRLGAGRDGASSFQVLEMVRNRSAEIGAPLAVVGISGWRLLDRPSWRRDNNERLIDSGKGGPDAPILMLDGITKRLQVSQLDLRASFAPRVDADGLYHYHIDGDGHWTAAGNRLAAKSVAAFLVEQGLLPR